MRRIAKAFGLLIMIIAIAVAVGTLVPRPLTGATEAAGGNRYRILLLSNPIHTDIAIPLDAQVRETFGFLERDGMPLDASKARYLVFGWGGRAFYLETPTWSELQARPLIKGLTADASVMHVDVIGEVPLPHPAAESYDIDEAAFARLLQHIRSSFREESGAPIVIPDAGYSAFDRFYEANGTFTALLGCNTWTATGLRAADLRTGLWNPLPALLRFSMRLYN